MDPPFRFPAPETVDLDAEIVADRHKRVKQVPAVNLRRQIMPGAGGNRSGCA
jgi:hypothetical protein